jgi:uncharacterized membrane protein HdeD (DUF308 family)
MKWFVDWVVEPGLVGLCGYIFALFFHRPIQWLVKAKLREEEFRVRLGISEKDYKEHAEAFIVKAERYALRWLLFLVVTILVVGSIVVVAEPFLKTPALWMMSKLGLRLTQLLVGAGVLPLGFGAFFFKLRHQKTYGCVEILFAGIAAVIAARQMKPASDWSGQIATLVGAVYIVSRGLSNIKDGFKTKNANG